MAQKTIVTIWCDLPHKEDTEGTETIAFSFDGTPYEIDVCAKHAKELKEAFGAYTEHARRAGAASHGKRTPRTTPARDRNGDIRAWAKQNGHAINERGRIPTSIVADYEAVH